MIRKQVTIKGVLRPVIAMIAANAIVLTLWTILDPLQWTRMIVSEDGYGYVLSSIGQCTSQNELPFILSLGLINAVSMIFALVLSYKVSDERSCADTEYLLTRSYYSFRFKIFPASTKKENTLDLPSFQ